MDLKAFLSSKYESDTFESFIKERFYGLDIYDNGYTDEFLSESEKKSIDSYRFLGKVNLDDGKEIGFFEFKSTTTQIENKRVGYNAILKKLAYDESLNGAIASFYHPDGSVWRLSFVGFEYDEGKAHVTNLKRFTYVLGEGVLVKTAQSQLKLLENNTKPTKALLAEIFSVENLNKRFFEDYKKLFEMLNEELIENNLANFQRDDANIRAFNKKLLGRIVFLYFLQKKGWLGVKEMWGDGDKKFLQKTFGEVEQTKINFYELYLKPIFFEALNTDRRDSEDYFELLKCKMPFLNGGLFESKGFDEEFLSIDNKIFETIFEKLSQYNFTVMEDSIDESEVAIDPEMLGHVFESLLEENYRKGKGAFYTPREIVSYMCSSSIDEYLSDKTDKLQALKSIKILDPAIGSGAFPMGMLHEIVQRRVENGDTLDMATLKREIIENSIYGVDIDGEAVEIAKLQFWLSLTVDETTPSPLPNLDFKIMQGNSLIETINGFDPIPLDIYQKKEAKKLNLFDDEEATLFDETLYDGLTTKIHKFYSDTNPNDKSEHKDEIKNLVQDLIMSYIENQDRDWKFNNEGTTYGQEEARKKKEKLAIQALENSALAQTIINDMLANNFQTKELFLYKLWFGEVLKEGGFDVVIGNPPYIRQEKIKELKPKLQIEDYKSYNGTADIYVYFFEQGYRLLKDGGSLSFITSNKYTRAKYGKEFREFILKNTDILEYIDFNGVKVFESATVDTSILSFKKNGSGTVGVVPRVYPKHTGQPQGIAPTFLYCDITSKYKKGESLKDFCTQFGFDYAQSDLSTDSFSFANPQELAIKKRIEAIGTPLKEWDIKINYGIKTGFNEAFIIDGKTKDELIAKDPKSSEIIKPMLRGRDIKRYGYEFANLWLINTFNGDFVVKDLPRANQVDIDDYPAIKEHLDKYLPQLENRADKGDSPYHLRNCAYNDEFEKEKIVYPEFSSENCFAWDDILKFTSDTAWIITNSSKYLVACLNSKVIWFYLKSIVASLGEASFRMKKIYLDLLPIPKISKEAQKPFDILVDYILFAKAQGLNLEASSFESVIDGLVYDLYFEEEMKKGDCFITDEVVKAIKPCDNTQEGIMQMYQIFKNNKDIQRGLIYRRVLSVVKVINGENK